MHLLHTVVNTASNAIPMASVTVAFLSFSRSSIGGTTLSLYLPNGAMMPFARPSIHPAATVTQITFGVNNPTAAVGFRERTFFTPDRRTREPSAVELRKRDSFLIPYLTLKHSFG